MENGILSTRYARALLAFAQSKGTEEAVYHQFERLITAWQQEPMLRQVLNDPLVKDPVKLNLLIHAVGEPICPELERFFRMVIRHKRETYLEVIGLIYGKLYRKLKRIYRINLYAVQPLSPETKERLQQVVQTQRGVQVELLEHIDPSLIGGFILRTDQERMDASIASQLKRLGQQLRYRDNKQMNQKEY